MQFHHTNIYYIHIHFTHFFYFLSLSDINTHGNVNYIFLKNCIKIAFSQSTTEIHIA